MRILTVDQVTAYLKDLIEADPIVSDVWVRGEITNFFESNAGHCYFTLSDEFAQLKCVLFRHMRKNAIRMPRQGDAVVAHGQISIYEAQGQYQLYVDLLSPDGDGLFRLQFEQLKQRLEAEGLFAEDRKRPLPAVPRVIGVVTSPQGAVWHDIQTVIRRRFPLVELVLSPSQVQGSEAPASLVAALRNLWELEECDVIIIGRGGGAPEELAVFNDETLARAIYASPVPVVSAVGHETDFTIADLVADLRAPTPSAAAEIVVPSRHEIRQNILARLADARGSLLGKIDESTAAARIRYSRMTRHSPHRRIDEAHQRAAMLRMRASLATKTQLRQQRHRLEAKNSRLHALDPAAVLERGYAVVARRSDRTRIISIAEASAARDVILTLKDGEIPATVGSVTDE